MLSPDLTLEATPGSGLLVPSPQLLEISIFGPQRAQGGWKHHPGLGAGAGVGGGGAVGLPTEGVGGERDSQRARVTSQVPGVLVP